MSQGYALDMPLVLGGGHHQQQPQASTTLVLKVDVTAITTPCMCCVRVCYVYEFYLQYNLSCGLLRHKEAFLPLLEKTGKGGIFLPNPAERASDGVMSWLAVVAHGLLVVQGDRPFLPVRPPSPQRRVNKMWFCNAEARQQ